MLNALAFLQTADDAIACAEGPLDTVAYPRPGSPAFFAPDFALSTDRPWWLDARGRPLRTLSRAEWLDRFPPACLDAPVQWGRPDSRRFAAGFDTLKRHLDAGALRKGVPVTAMTARLAADAAARLFRHALARVPHLPSGLFAYGVYLPPSGDRPAPEFMIGATPEMLFEIDRPDHLKTMAVAGTRPAEAGPASLEASPKERDEHQSVVEDLLAQLGDWGAARASTTEVRPFGALQHLVADIELDARTSLDFEAVARRLHPTPALGVYPRSALGGRWLQEIDGARTRKRFGAPFGLRLPSGRGRCLVAIRNLQYSNGLLEIWAGCGVVSQSRYEDEWDEVLHKMRAVRTLWDV